MKRTILAACVLLAGLGGLCAAWYASSQRALDAEQREREHAALRASAEAERASAETLSRKLEELRAAESQRPYFHYQNLYHDPKGASEGLSIVPSPLAGGSGNPLVVAHFQLESNGRVTLPTLNEELRELNAPNASQQRSIRDTLAQSKDAVFNAAKPLLAALTTEESQSRATAERIADLEARLAASQAAAARRPPVSVAAAAPPQPQATSQQAATQQAATQQAVATQQKIETLDPSAFMQNSRSNEVYRELKQRGASQNRGNVEQSPSAAQPVTIATATPSALPPATAPPPATPSASSTEVVESPPLPPAPPRRERPVEIRTTDLEWHTVDVGGRPRLVALRGVRTPAGNLVQGLLTSLEGGGAVPRAGGSSIGGTGWRVQLNSAATLASIRRDQLRARGRFQRTFVGVTALLLFVVAGIVWMVWRTEALALEKSRFAATAAHELRTPLASLRLYSEMIADEQNPARRERYAREIVGQTERLGRIVANVLEVTRIERGTFALQPREGEIGRAVEECIEKLRPQMEAAGCPVALRVDPDLPRVAFDSDALHHIVDNLLDNAEKYSRDAAQRDIAVAVAPENGGVSITVSDRGPGLSDDVFREPRPFRRSAGGLGLGLFLVHRIVRGHGGAIHSAPRPGGGASVRIFFPLAVTGDR